MNKFNTFFEMDTKTIAFKNSKKFYSKNFLISALFRLLIVILTPKINFLLSKNGVCFLNLFGILL